LGARDEERPAHAGQRQQQERQGGRRGEGPVLLECKTFRLSGHYNKDIEHYRPHEDSEAARTGDAHPDTHDDLRISMQRRVSPYARVSVG